MATVFTTLFAERWLDIVELAGVQSNIGADDISEFLLPLNFGDVAVMWIDAMHEGITTMPAAASLAVLGFHARLLSAGDSVIGPVGVSQNFRQVSVARVSAELNPDALVLWRQGEKIQIATPDLDAGNTVDHTYWFHCVRVRPQEEQVPGPIRFVR